MKGFGGLAAATLAGALSLAPEARADLRVCNGTPSPVGVAVGYRGGEGWVSEGWWQIKAAKCDTVIKGPLNSRFYYLYAETEGGGRWSGDVSMCVTDEEFRITDVKDCFVRGYTRADFREYDTKQQLNWMIQLTDAAHEWENGN